MTTETRLWFDVGIKRYTTFPLTATRLQLLWFDVGIKRYTTFILRMAANRCCGLM